MTIFGRVKRAWFEMKDHPVVPVDSKKMKMELDGLSFGLRCLMSMGGYKFKPEGLKDDELKQRADGTATLCANLHLMVRCAEDVIIRHNLLDEYRTQLAKVEEALNAAATIPQGDQLAAMKALVESSKKEDQVQRAVKAVQDEIDRRAGREGERSMDQEVIRADPTGATDN
jgi:hypothetical protein